MFFFCFDNTRILPVLIFVRICVWNLFRNVFLASFHLDEEEGLVVLFVLCSSCRIAL